MARPSILPCLALSFFAVVVGAQTTKTFTYGVKGVSRSFVAHVPAGISKPPVVFFVHGYGGSGSGFQKDTRADAIADREKFIAVYPSAVGGSWSMNDSSDYPFLRSIVDTVDANWKIDRSRVYCAGFSQGGFISFGLGYKHPEIFAAVAPVSGHVPSFSTASPLRRPVPMFLTFGTKDISDVASFMADVTKWMRLDSCSGARTTQRPYPANRPRSTVVRITYACAQGSEIVVDSVIGGGHEWAMDTDTKVNTTEEVWAFFKRFSLQGASGTEMRSRRGDTPAVRWMGGVLHLDGIATGSVVDVRDARGALEFSGVVDGGMLRCARLSSGLHVASFGSRRRTFVVP